MKLLKKQVTWLGIILIGLVVIYLIITNKHLKRVVSNFQDSTETTVANEEDKYSISAQKEGPQNQTPNQAMADAKSVPIDNGICNNSQDPVNVCINYDSCCSSLDNCVCQNPVNKDCQDAYKDCLADKYLSPANMEYISTDKKDVVCKKILTNCCKSVLYTSKAKKKDYEKVTMSMPENGSKILCGFAGEEATALSACKQSCNLNDQCKSVIYNKAMGRCDIYDKSLVEKPGFMKNETDKETVQLIRVEGFQNNNNGMSAVDNAANYCYNSGMGLETMSGSCYEKNAIVTDCRSQFDKCLTRDIAGLTPAKKKEHCSTMYGSCCSIVDGLNVVERFRFLDPELGGGNPKNKICSWDASSLEECKNKCFADPGCSYIYSNLVGKGEQPPAVKKCSLYSGEPVTGSIPSFGKGDGFGKFIYKKVVVNPDDEINEPTTTMASTIPTQSTE
jgi:hypothetical protein